MIVALAGGVGAGKFLRGLVRVVDPHDVTAIVNTADDLTLHGLHISPDVDSVLYWLAGVADRPRGWGREGESFRAMDALRQLGGAAWFGLGDTDLATHLLRTDLLRSGRTLTEATDELRRRFGVAARILPMSNDRVTTRIDAVDDSGRALDLHFQEYWVARGAGDEVKDVRFEGADRASPAPGVVEAIREAETIIVCPSNPVASIRPILDVRPIGDELRSRRGVAVGISPIVGGAPLRGMADRLMPAMGMELSAFGAAAAYQGLLGSFVIDEKDGGLADPIRSELGMRVAVVDTVMVDDSVAEAVARTALDLARR
jgi:LPPG:FO 2-phospho-L-lactate transferase